MVSHKNYNLSANKDFIILLTSKLITCFIGDFTSKMKSQSIAYLLNGSEHIYWIWNLADEVHAIWNLWIRGFQECKVFPKLGCGLQECKVFSKSDGQQQFLVGSAAPARIYLPRKVRGGWGTY